MGDSTGATTDRQARAFTLKSLFFSLLGIAVITGLASIQWNLVGANPAMIGNHLPAGVFFYIMLVALVWNGLTARLCPQLALNQRELAVVMGASLIAAFPPTSGLFRYFHRQLMLPWYYLGTGGKPEWDTFDVLGYLPGRLFPQPAPEYVDGVLKMDQTVYNGFFTGMLKGDQTLGLGQLPWRSWLTPLLFWGPVVFVYSVAIMALSLIVHQQWVRHEQLSYPVAQVAISFVYRAKGVGIPDLFRNKLFWWGFMPIFLLYGLEYLHQWFPEFVPSYRLVFPNLKSWWLNVGGKMPVIKNAPAWWTIQSGTIFFTIVGLSYFVSSEIALSFGLSHIMLVVVGVWFFKSTGQPITGNQLTMFRAGGYFGFALILLYTGRSFYWAVTRKAFGWGRAGDHEAASVMAARVFVLCTLGFVGLLVSAGLDWLVALVFTLVLTLTFLVLTRLVCETGVPFVQPNWLPGPVIASLLGPGAVGPGPMVWINYLGSVLAQDPRECLMPYAATAFKVADEARVRIRRFFWFLVAALALAMVVGFVTTHWTLYNYGGMSTDGYASRHTPQGCFDDGVKTIMELRDLGLYERSSAATGLGKLALLAPIFEDVRPWALGIVAVLLVSMLRFRFSKFPLHPAVFLILGAYAGYMSWYSFLVGWGIKSLVVRFGGGKVYQNLKPLFVGVIAGELMAVGFCIMITMLYYWLTSELPQVSFGILPG